MSKSPLLVQALKRQIVDRPPIWFMRQAGRYLPEYWTIRTKFPNFIEFCLTPDAATKVTIQPVQRFGLDAAIIFSDILTIPHALGHTVNFLEGYGPRVKPIVNLTDIQILQNHLSEITKVLTPVFQTVKQTRLALSIDKAVIGFCGAPFTLACYMFDNKPSQGTPNLTRFVAEYPQAFNQLLDILTDACADYLSGQIKAGADAIQIFDSWAGSCPLDQWQAWVYTPLMNLSRKVKANHPETPIILFPRLANQSQLQMLADHSAGVFEGLSLSTETDLVWASDNLQPKVAIQGNIDPLLFTQPTPDAVLSATRRALDIAAGKPGYVVNLGHGFTPETNPLFVQLVVDVIKNHRQR